MPPQAPVPPLPDPPPAPPTLPPNVPYVDPTVEPANRYASLVGAIHGAQQAGGPSPLGSFPELQKLYDLTAGLPMSSQQVAGDSYNAAVTVENQRKAQAAAQAAAEAKKDPSNYRRIPKSDGGYAFVDPDGNELSAFEYARIVGKSPVEVLKDSLNPIDKRFAQDYKQLEAYINNKASAKNDPKAKAAADAVEKQVKKLYNIDLKRTDTSEVFNALVKAYPTVFGGKGAGRQGSNTLLPNSNQIKKAQSGASSIGATGGLKR